MRPGKKSPRMRGPEKMAKVTAQRVKRAYRELWEQYEEMEGQFDDLLRKLASLKKELAKREEMTANLKAILDQRDRKMEKFKSRIFESERRVEARRTELELVERYMAEDRSAHDAALDTIAMLKKDLEVANEEVRLRDYWFSANRQLFEHLVDIQKQREETIAKARIRGVREFKVLEEGPSLEEALEELGLEEGLKARIKEKAGDRTASDMLPLSEERLEEEVRFERTEAFLVRRALDRIGFGELRGVEVRTAPPSSGELSVAVNPPPSLDDAGGMAVLSVEEPGEYGAGLDAGTAEVARGLAMGLSRVLDGGGGNLQKVRLLLTREGEQAAVMDNRMMLRDNNFLLGVHRVKTRGISLVPGLVKPSADAGSAPDMTRDELYKDVVSRIVLEPERAREALDLRDASVETPRTREPHPYIAMALQAAVSYLKQHPGLTFEVYDIIVPPGSRIGFP
jgi:hypothetical protein